MKDFLFKPLTYRLEPMFLESDPEEWRILYLKIHGSDSAGVMEYCEKTWKTIDPVHPFLAEFYEDILRKTSETFQDTILVIGFLTLLVFTISLLGLLGISTFTAETKLKEVGIRKVFGAGIFNNGNFSVAPLFVDAFGCISHRHTHRHFDFEQTITNLRLPYLNQAERHYAGSRCDVFITGALTAAWQALKAALSNPVNRLRNE